MIYLDRKESSNTVRMEKKAVRDTRVTLVFSGILLLLFGVVITVLAVNVPEVSASRSFGSFLLKSGCAAAAFAMGCYNFLRAASMDKKD